MRKEVFFILGILFLILVGTLGVFAQSVLNSEVSKEVSDYVGSFLEKGGITSEEIKNVKEVDKNSLPDEVDIKKIEDNKVGIYEVNYTKGNVNQKLFVVTYSAKEFKKTDEIKNLQYLNFGFDGESGESSYLDSSTGVRTSDDVGYVMMRSGSITGISTSIVLNGEGKVNVKVYKNGKDTGFENLISSGDDKKKDYDLQSEDVVNYDAGDLIGVYVERIGDVNWSNVVTIVETTS